MKLLEALVCPLLLGKPNLSSGCLQMKVLVVVQELLLLGAQGHEHKTGVTAALFVQCYQAEPEKRKSLGQSLRYF
jgi:hypothetical protein